MTVDRWQRIQDLFDEALGQPEGERERFLQAVCGEDLELLHDVSTLLAHDSAAEPAFLEPPQRLLGALPRSRAEITNALVGRKVGNYELEAVIGQGGMSTVYKALQEQPRRVVALKVMRAGFASSSALRRFQLEAQVLARLQHPNIAQVYEAGTHDDGDTGVPWFAMEYVPGARAIIDYVDHKKLGTRARLELFAQVCEAVQHGHQRGIIHRDLKPANILVDEGGHVKVIDFGVARATDSDVAVTTMHTDAGQLVGTLQYMSPEQCDADPHELDVRSDVYSLGAVLYELLTGELPYDAGGSSIYRATRVIKETAPARPSSVDARLRGDIETIVLKSLEKDRDRRYQSIADLARDICHYLNKEPIEARTPSLWVRVTRSVARHPALAKAMSYLAIGLLCLAVSLTTVWHLDQRPDHLQIEDDHRRARLLARTGKELHTWQVQAPAAIGAALLTDLPSDYGGGKLVLLGYGVTPNHEDAGYVCAFSVSDAEYDKPKWRKRIKPDDVPETLTLRGKTADLAGVKALYLADIFTELPGEEIVAIHDFDGSSVRAIRVLDLEGNVHYQAWHDGDFSAWHWMSGPGLLVLMGDNCEAFWDARGKPNAIDPYPFVVFAIKPVQGVRSNQFLRTCPGEDPLSPVWYRCLHYPFSELSVGGFQLSTPPLSPDGDKSVEFVFYVGWDRLNAGIDWTIDAEGDMIPGTRAGNDFFQRNTSLPPLEKFYLGDLPPIVSKSEGPGESFTP